MDTPDRSTFNQIDHIVIDGSHVSSILDVSTFRLLGKPSLVSSIHPNEINGKMRSVTRYLQQKRRIQENLAVSRYVKHCRELREEERLFRRMKGVGCTDIGIALENFIKRLNV